jgi:hypothetical protein
VKDKRNRRAAMGLKIYRGGATCDLHSEKFGSLGVLNKTMFGSLNIKSDRRKNT